MVVPSRKSEMIKNIMRNQEREKKKSVKEIENRKISQEEHKERLKKLKEIGLIK